MALGSRMDLDNPCLLSMSVVLVTMWLLAVAQLVDTRTHSISICWHLPPTLVQLLLLQSHGSNVNCTPPAQTCFTMFCSRLNPGKND